MKITNQKCSVDLELGVDEIVEFLRYKTSPSVVYNHWPKIISTATEKFGGVITLSPFHGGGKRQTGGPLKHRVKTEVLHYLWGTLSTIHSDIVWGDWETPPLLADVYKFVFTGVVPLLPPKVQSPPKDNNIYSEEVEKLKQTLRSISDIDIPRPAVFLYGPPGTGKTSFVKDFDEPYNVLRLSNIGKTKVMTDDEIVVIDEIDKANQPQLEWLSEFLDNKPSETLVVITSNSGPDTLPDHLLRPGRVDHLIEVGYLNEERAIELFKRVFGSETYEKAFEAYCKANNYPKLFQPAAVHSMGNNWIQSSIALLVKNNISVGELANQPEYVHNSLSESIRLLKMKYRGDTEL